MGERRPKGCEACTQECTIHLTQIVNGTMASVDLCEACPHAKCVEKNPPLDIIEQLLGGAASEAEVEEERPKPLRRRNRSKHAGFDEPTCDLCGFTEALFQKRRRLGCPSCYKAFQGLVRVLLPDIHQGTQHRGKRPGENALRSTNLGLKDLKRTLEEAVASERFEEAARLRDAIEYLEQKDS